MFLSRLHGVDIVVTQADVAIGDDIPEDMTQGASDALGRQWDTRTARMPLPLEQPPGNEMVGASGSGGGASSSRDGARSGA